MSQDKWINAHAWRSVLRNHSTESRSWYSLPRSIRYSYLNKVMKEEPTTSRYIDSINCYHKQGGTDHESIHQLHQLLPQTYAECVFRKMYRLYCFLTNPTCSTRKSKLSILAITSKSTRVHSHNKGPNNVKDIVKFVSAQYTAECAGDKGR
jgi:hypothetical protein